MNPKPHRGTIRLLAGIALIALVSAACVKADPPGVSISEVKTSAKFGFEEKEKTLAEFDVPEDVALQGSTPLPDLPLSSFTSSVGIRKKVVTGNPDCPEALEDAFPKDVATVQVRGLPTEGTYKWKREAVIRVDRSKKPPVVGVFDTLETRYIRGVARTPGKDHEFKFQMIAPDATSTNVIVTSFLVNTNPVLLVNERVDSRTVGVTDISGADVRVTPPHDAPGVYITRIETKDVKNASLFSFSPVRPMLILPLEEGIIRTGQTFSSVGIDPTTGDVLMNEGTVGRTSRVDACGEIVDGYALSIDQSYTRDVNTADLPTDVQKFQTRQLTRNIQYVFATQYGLLPIAENIKIGEFSDKIALLAVRSLGALKAEPLPPSVK